KQTRGRSVAAAWARLPSVAPGVDLRASLAPSRERFREPQPQKEPPASHSAGRRSRTVRGAQAARETGQAPVNNADSNDGLPRSEEHTSELPSRGLLVCRPLLDKRQSAKSVIS